MNGVMDADTAARMANALEIAGYSTLAREIRQKVLPVAEIFIQVLISLVNPRRKNETSNS